jgi:hypothetical protein
VLAIRAAALGASQFPTEERQPASKELLRMGTADDRPRGDVQPARTNDYGFSLGAPLWPGAMLSLDGSQQKIAAA